MEKSTSIKNIAKALLIFHGKVQTVKKSEVNPFFKSKYADLPAILESIQEPLQDSGLSFVQFPEENSLTTILMHAESGEYLQATYNIHAEKVTPQGMGSAITYARRYALGAILGLNTDNDDDGNNITSLWISSINSIQKYDLESANTLLEISKKDNASPATKSFLIKVCKDRGMVFNTNSRLFDVIK